MSELLDPLDADQAEAQYWALRLADGWAMELGAAVAARDRASEAVLAMTNAGATSEDVLAGLVMAGLARRVRRFRDLVPFLRQRGGELYEVLPPGSDSRFDG